MLCLTDVMLELSCSVFFGIGVALVLVFLMRFAREQSNSRGIVMYIFVCAFFIYSLAETVGLSGIVANLFAGIIFRLYGAPQLTPECQHSCTEFLELFANFADSFVFLLCGASTALINSWRAVLFGCVAPVFCLVARAASVITCSAVSNSVKLAAGDESIITWKHQLCMTHSGLRGGIALVLALQLGDWCTNRSLIIDVTFIVISTFLVVCGCTTDLLLRSLHLVANDEEGDSECAPLVSHTLVRKDDFIARTGNYFHDQLSFFLVDPPRKV